MIRRHDFNSEWWGKDVGIVSEPGFFELPSREQSAALGRFAWVEFAQPVSRLVSRRALAQSGFFYADTQLRFRLDLRKIPPTQRTRELAVNSAAESRFEIRPEEIRPFQHERFSMLPGVSPSSLSARYALWAARLISQHPTTSLRFSRDGATQGWFLAQGENEGLQLTLAMLNTRASVSGYDLYAEAIRYFSELGHRLGYASFSVRNSNVLNIYSQLGARFVEPRECWIWIAPSSPSSGDPNHGNV